MSTLASRLGLTLDARHGPLPLLLLVLTVVTGLIDAASFLTLGHVFVANMTGNIAFLGFAVADAKDFSIVASLLAALVFMLGALAGGRLATRLAHHRGRYLAVVIYLEIVLVAAALIICSLAGVDRSADALIALLAAAMGLQNAGARKLGVPDLNTTVLTLTLTGLAAESHLAGGSNPNAARRLTATVMMFVGAAVGALLIFRFGLVADLALVLALLTADVVACARLGASDAGWTAGKA